MPAFWQAIFLGVFLVLQTVSCHDEPDLECNVCNNAMGTKPIVSDCATGDIPANCSHGVNYCMRLQGTYFVVGSKEPAQPPGFVGTHRDCGTPFNQRLYADVAPTGDVSCHDVDRRNVAIDEGTNKDAVMYFKGRVCFCNSKRCNDDRELSGATVSYSALQAFTCILFGFFALFH